MLPPSAPSTPTAPTEATAPGVAHAFGFYDGVTGEALAPAEVAALTTTFVNAEGEVIDTADEPVRGDAARLVRAALPERGSYTIRVDGGGSLRYFGCSASFEVRGERERRFRVLLVPRQREVALSVEAGREGRFRALPDEAQAAVEMRADAAHEREVEVRRGACEGTARGGHRWCVRSLAEAPGTVGLSVRAPGYPIAAVSVEGTSPARAVPLAVRYEGQLLPRVSLRAGIASGVVRGNGLGGGVGVEVPLASRLLGMTCPMGTTCARPLLHAGFLALPYQRDTELIGPGTRTTTDATLTGATLSMEVGAGVAVYPGGTGDKLRVVAMGHFLYAFRGDERDAAHNLTLSPAAAQFGLGLDALVEYRLAGTFFAYAGARLNAFPTFGSRGRTFSYLGDAPVSDTLASLVQLALVAGLGVEL